MKKVSKGIDELYPFVGLTFTCPRTDNEYKIEREDIDALEPKGEKLAAPPKGIRCPDCNKLVAFETSQRDGRYLSHP